MSEAEDIRAQAEAVRALADAYEALAAATERVHALGGVSPAVVGATYMRDKEGDYWTRENDGTYTWSHYSNGAARTTYDGDTFAKRTLESLESYELLPSHRP